MYVKSAQKPGSKTLRHIVKIAALIIEIIGGSKIAASIIMASTYRGMLRISYAGIENGNNGGGMRAIA